MSHLYLLEYSCKYRIDIWQNHQVFAMYIQVRYIGDIPQWANDYYYCRFLTSYMLDMDTIICNANDWLYGGRCELT